jgi:hypothetical protein
LYKKINIISWYVYIRCIFWIPYWPNYIYWWTPRMLGMCWKSTIRCPCKKIFWFCVNGQISPLSIFNIIYFSALSIFIFKISPLKVVVIWFTSGSQTFKIPKKYDLFSPNTKILCRFDRKVGRKLSQAMWFQCIKSLTHRNYAICMYRWEGWWKCFKMLTIILLSFLKHSNKPSPWWCICAKIWFNSYGKFVC